VKPALQTQSLIDMLELGAAALEGQSVQALLPAFEYFPSSQGMQSASASFPTVARNLPAAQLRHVAADVAPTASEYLPDSQSVHWPPPAHVPAGQDMSQPP
jgi:hypothetical protein